MPFAREVLVRCIGGSLLLSGAVLATTGEPPAASTGGGLDAAAYEQCHENCEERRQLSDLTPLNFFTEGWDEAWSHRHRETPDMSLLRVTTNFLERELRLDYVFTAVNNNPKVNDSQLLNTLIAYGINRRLMVEVIGNYQWNVPPGGSPTANGAGMAGVLRFQLVDTQTASYAFQYRVSAPNKGLGQTTTSMQYVLAGWQDVTAWIPALKRVGIYYSFQYENLLGPHKATATLNDLTYVLSFAKTWTAATTPVLGNLTTSSSLLA